MSSNSFKLTVLFILLSVSVAFANPTLPPLTVTEEDGSPSVIPVFTIKFANGTVTDNGDQTVSIAGGSGETNTMSNVGTGSQIFKQKTGVDFELRSMVSGDNVTLATNANDIEINVSSFPSEDVVGIFDIANTNLTAGDNVNLTGAIVSVPTYPSEDVVGIFDIASDTNLVGGNAITLSGSTINFDGGASPGGELGGTWASPTIDDSLAVTSWNLTTPTITTSATVTDGAWIGLGVGKGLIQFDDEVTDFVSISNANVGIGTDTPNQKLTVEGTMSLKEQADASADTAAYGQFWVKSDGPNNAYFTDDAGNDRQLAYAGGAFHDGFSDFSADEHFTQANITAVGTIATGTWQATDIGVEYGGTGASTLTDGGVLLGSGTDPITAMGVLADGSIIVGDGATDPVALAAFTSSTGDLKHEAGGLEFDASGVAIGDIIAGTGAGTMALVTATGHADGDVLTLQADGSADWEAAGGATNPTGTVLIWPTDSAPSGYLLCDGTAVSRTTYATLFTAIGTTYGAGDESTTFNVPDLRGRFPLGKDNMGGSSANRVTNAQADSLAGYGGAELHTLTIAEMPAHTHNISSNTPAGTSARAQRSTTHVSNIESSSTGGGGSHNNMPPYLTMNYVIKT